MLDARGSREIPALEFSACLAKGGGDGQRKATVLEHCTRTGELARSLSEMLPGCVRQQLPDGLASLVAAHDVGKVSPGYLGKYFASTLPAGTPSMAGFEDHHATISEAAVAAWLRERVTAGPAAKQWAQVAGQHHGRRELPLNHSCGQYGGGKWAEQRLRLVAAIQDRLGDLPSAGPANDAQLWLVAGFTSVCDWIASDDSLFPDDGQGVSALDASRRALETADWRFPSPRPACTFEDLFGFPPNAMQTTLAETATGPGVYVVEASTGQGKTEAALYAAYRLMCLGKNYGLYFALPTRLTSNRIHMRVGSFLRLAFGDDAAARLVHGNAWLESMKYGGEELAPRGSWFHPSRRALLFPFGVGTIDQALMAVLNVRHHAVRAFGLAGKVIVLDEVHSYDLYTGTLLDKLVEVAGRLGCTVIILSATLTARRKGALVGDRREMPAGCSEYPLLTAVRSGTTAELPVSGPAPRNVELRLADGDWRVPLGEAVDRASGGQAVLCIANTVGQAQEWFAWLRSEMREEAFVAGLLHSRFPQYRRDALEAFWMEELGKECCWPRRRGSLLVATQVVEQSVDIDADFLVTALAPSDMLVQRLGRLWRHARGVRRCGVPSATVQAPSVEQSTDEHAFLDSLGMSRFVYAPYVLWRTLNVWRDRRSIQIPTDVRALLEETYGPPIGREPAWVVRLAEELERRRKLLHDLALAGTAEAMPTNHDDDQAATRYSDRPERNVLLVRDLKTAGDVADLVLANGQAVRLESNRMNIREVALLHSCLLRVPWSWAKAPAEARFLRGFIHGPTSVLVVGPWGNLSLLDGAPSLLRYDEVVGLSRIAAANAHTASEFYVEDTDELDW